MQSGSRPTRRRRDFFALQLFAVSNSDGFGLVVSSQFGGVLHFRSIRGFCKHFLNILFHKIVRKLKRENCGSWFSLFGSISIEKYPRQIEKSKHFGMGLKGKQMLFSYLLSTILGLIIRGNFKK